MWDVEQRPVVAVVGPGGAAEGGLLDLAREVGRLLAARGAIVVTGGLDGVMSAAAQGVQDGRGFVLGLLPGSSRADGNEYLDVAVPTGLGQARNALLVAAADGLVAVGGSWGTLSEIALARRTGKPVVCLRGWQVRDADGVTVPVESAASAGDAVDALFAALAQG
jgi:uncharacterized protein (TIGR00725 family)